jgi:hypothetical protein
MRRGLAAAAVWALLLPGLALAATPAAKRSLHASLSGKVVVPAKGASGASGKIVLTMDADAGQACWIFKGVKNVPKPLSAHVHRGLPSKTGAVVIPLGDKYAAKGCVSLPKPVVKAVLAAPGRYYVDIHSRPFLNGAARGQLRPGA